MFTPRYIYSNILEDLKQKMVFIGGPRQVGKTTLAKHIGSTFTSSMYLNWDHRADRKHILQESFMPDAQLLTFDEVHKYRKWKNYIKGVFDTQHEQYRILVTGSARLDLYKKGGDSLLGRYHYYRLHPFSVAELVQKQNTFEPFQPIDFSVNQQLGGSFKQLLTFGGFPEPLFTQNEQILRRWHNERVDRLIREDIRDVELVRDISALQILADILPEKVGSRLSLNALREDLEVTHKTIALWVEILERFYYHFRIYPFTSRTIQSLRKEPKLYLWDWSQVETPAARLENIVASHLLKFVHYLVDVHGYKAELYYLRDVQGHEVDFLVSVNKRPWFAVEVKSSDLKPAKHLLYFQNKLKIPFLYQVVNEENIDLLIQNVRVMSVAKFLAGLV